MKNKLTTREQKIKFLNDLKKGRAKIEDILPGDYSVFIVGNDGRYFNARTRESYTEEEYKKRHPNDIDCSLIIDFTKAL